MKAYALIIPLLFYSLFVFGLEREYDIIKGKKNLGGKYDLDDKYYCEGRSYVWKGVPRGSSCYGSVLESVEDP